MVLTRVVADGAPGVVIGTAYWLLEAQILSLFTTNEMTKVEIRRVWLFLILVQPLNSLVNKQKACMDVIINV